MSQHALLVSLLTIPLLSQTAEKNILPKTVITVTLEEVGEDLGGVSSENIKLSIDANTTFIDIQNQLSRDQHRNVTVMGINTYYNNKYNFTGCIFAFNPKVLANSCFDPKCNSIAAYTRPFLHPYIYGQPSDTYTQLRNRELTGKQIRDKRKPYF